MIDIISRVGRGDKIRGYNDICQLFITKYRQKTIYPSTVKQVNFNLSRSGRPRAGLK